LSKELEELEKIEQTHQEQMTQIMLDVKSGRIDFDEAKRILLADTQQAIAKLKDLLPKSEDDNADEIG
jgi:hypothetical protein